jgi:ATP-binding cassette, subfamily C, bacterial
MLSTKKRLKTPQVLQYATTDCGIACLTSVLRFYGCWVSQEQVRESCAVGRDGSTALEIVQAARKWGLVAKCKIRTAQNIEQAAFPCVAFWQDSHFLIIEGTEADSVWINDPARGKYRLSRAEFEENYSKVVIELFPGGTFCKQATKKELWEAIRWRLQLAPSAVAAIVVLSVLKVLPRLIFSALVQVVIDEILINEHADWGRPLFWLTAISGLLVWALTAQLLKTLNHLYKKMQLLGQPQYLWHLLMLPLDFFRQRYVGDLAMRTAEVQILNEEVTYRILWAISEGCLGLASLLMLVLYVPPLLSLPVILVSALGFWLITQQQEALYNSNLGQAQDLGQLNGLTAGGLANLDSLKASGSEPYLFRVLMGLTTQILERGRRLRLQQIGLGLVPVALNHLIMAITLGLGGWLVMTGQISLGVLFGFQLLVIGLQQSLSSLFKLPQAWESNRAHTERLNEVLKSEIPDGAVHNRTQEPGSALSLVNLTYYHHGCSTPALADINLTLAPGQVLGIIGASGSGKSTLAKIMVGLVEPSQPEMVQLGDIPLSELVPAERCQWIGILEQDMVLFEGTIRDNLTLWDPTIPEVDLIAACRDAEIYDLICRLPGGFDHSVGELGINFSGGERQRLELARVLLQNPRILIFDEATSALDVLTEAAVIENLRQRPFAQIVIAHRQSALRGCDSVVVLENGRMVDWGEPSEILTRWQTAHTPELSLTSVNSLPADTITEYAPVLPELPKPDLVGLLLSDANGVEWRQPEAVALGVVLHAIQAHTQIHETSPYPGEPCLEAVARASDIPLRRVMVEATQSTPGIAFLEGQPIGVVPEKGRLKYFDNQQQSWQPLDHDLPLGAVGYQVYAKLPKKIKPLGMFRFGFLGKVAEIQKLGLVTVVMGCFSLLLPQITAAFVDVVSTGNQLLLWQMTAGIVMLGIIQVFGQIQNEVSSLNLEQHAEERLQAGLVDRLLRLPLAYLRGVPTMEVLIRLNVLGDVRRAISQVGIVTFTSGLFSLLSLGLLFFYSRGLCFVFLGLGVAASVWIGWQVSRLHGLEERNQLLKMQLASFQCQQIRGISKLRGAGAVGRSLAVWTRQFKQQVQLQLSIRTIQNRLIIFQQTAPWVTTSVLIFALTGENRMGLAAFAGTQAAVQIAMQGLTQLGCGLGDASEIPALWRRGAELLSIEPEKQGGTRPQNLQGRLRISGLSFGYRDHLPLLTKICFEIAPGEMVAFVGPTGSGKSTLIRLLLGFETPSQGDIFYDDWRLSDLHLPSLRRQMGVVLQGSHLLAGTLMDNLTYGGQYSLSQVWEVLANVGLVDFVKQLPMGLKTVVAERGSNFSGGQHQKLLIARALISQPKILIFDEATSALDTESQAQIMANLSCLPVTRIVIAHRLATVQAADQIYVLNQGEIQQVTHPLLSSEPSLFAQMQNYQNFSLSTK